MPSVALRALILLLSLGILLGCERSDENLGEPALAEETHSKSGNEAFAEAHEYLRKGKVAELRVLLEEDPAVANTLYRGESLLNIVIDTRPEFPNMRASIEVLLEAGADPNLQAPNLLRKAIWQGDPETYGLLLEYGADPTIVWTKKNIDMLTYSRSQGDARFDEITDAWETAQLED